MNVDKVKIIFILVLISCTSFHSVSIEHLLSLGVDIDIYDISVIKADKVTKRKHTIIVIDIDYANTI